MKNIRMNAKQRNQAAKQLRKIVDRAGSQRKLGFIIGAAAQLVGNWLSTHQLIGANHVLNLIEANIKLGHNDITPKDLRPDVFHNDFVNYS